MKILLIAVFSLLLINPLWAEEPVELLRFKDMANDHVIVAEPWPRPTSVTFVSPDGRHAIIDFGGEKLTYKGDFPVDESAKIFFNAMFYRYLECSKEGQK